MIKRILSALLFLSMLCNYAFAQEIVPKDTLIILERNPGFFGFIESCPFYKLTISTDGKVELEPKDYKNENEQHKVISGKIVKGQITKDQVKQLIAEFEKIDYFSLNSTFDSPSKNNQIDCPQIIPDASLATTSITINGKSKTVEHYRGCLGTNPLSNLTRLENKIDEIVNIKQWFDCYLGKNRINLPF